MTIYLLSRDNRRSDERGASRGSEFSSRPRRSKIKVLSSSHASLYKTFKDDTPPRLSHFPELWEAIKARYHGHRKPRLHRLPLQLNEALVQGSPREPERSSLRFGQTQLL